METSRSSSSSSSSQYTSLLTAVAELRSDLERAVVRIQSLEEENLLLSSNNDSLEKALDTSRKRFQEMSETYTTTLSEKLDLEQQSEAFLETIKKNVTEKTKEFEALRDKFAGNDIDLIRVKVQEELEIPHKMRLQAKDEEIEEQREQFFQIRRELERYKGEHELTISSLNREILKLKADYDESMNALHKTELSLHEKTYETPEREALERGYNIKLTEQRHMIDTMREEVTQMRQERDEAVFALQQYKSQYEETVTHLRSKSVTAEAEKLGIETRITLLLAETDKKDSQLRSLRSVSDNYTNQLSEARQQINDYEKRISCLHDEYVRDNEEVRKLHDGEVRDYHHQIETTSTLLREREEQLRKMQRDITDMQNRYESGLSETRRSFQHEVQGLSKRNSSLESELCDEKNQRRRLEQQKLLEERNEIAEVLELRSELSRITREKDLLHEKLRDTESLAQEDKRNVTLSKREHDEMKKSNNVMTKELKDLREKHTKDAAEKEDLILALQKEMASRAINIEKLYKKNAEQLQKKYEYSLSKASKRADSYKDKALEAHKKLKEIAQR